MERVKVGEREVCQKALVSSVSSLYFMTLCIFCVVGWQLFPCDCTAIRSKISLGGKWEMVISVSKFFCVSLIAAHEWLSVLQSASCAEVSLLIW